MDQLGQFLLTFLLGGCVDIPGHALSVDGGRVAALPQMVVDLADAAGAWLPALAFVGLEGGRSGLRRLNILFLSGFRFCDSSVNLGGSSPLHLVCHMGVDVQRGAAGHMANDGMEMRELEGLGMDLWLIGHTHIP